MKLEVLFSSGLAIDNWYTRKGFHTPYLVWCCRRRWALSTLMPWVPSSQRQLRTVAFG